ncbi:PhzF family phenazine biosynthesis protein [Actinomadura rudentiformis]|uniref:PhzF family phenazine biosynthesis protein n=1 Tax=Actinomadura rudentiformis TaxID=359158 RepID=A0A6H9YKD6_9ACTN|nr:PhzF family phenazine biosynthesis protein [Actinomadura rudentiformis]KAB2340608.1 PhzF family phenazine biosynthesis protein [Actinomadura rudentiformis]
MLPARTCVVSGSAFVDPRDPDNALGNPFAVVMGADVKAFSAAQRQTLARRTGAPETVFVNAVRGTDGPTAYELDLTVLTPTGKALGVCAHGFIGAVYALIEAGLITAGLDLMISTPSGGSARASLSSDGTVMLHFVARESLSAYGREQALEEIFHVPLPSLADGLPVLSVGSPKLTVEVTPAAFALLRRELDGLDYDRLMALQRELDINGIHLFCRNTITRMPERAIQVNAYLGKSLVVDRATGVSNAAQVSADPHIHEGQQLQIAQYTQTGRSAVLTLTKGKELSVWVGGAATLLAHREIR